MQPYLRLVRSGTVMLNNGFHISHGVDVTKINVSFTVSSKISHRKASYNRHCAGQKDAKATNTYHQKGLN